MNEKEKAQPAIDEIKFEDMSVTIWFDDRARADAYEEGIGTFKNGWNIFHTADALKTIDCYDRALKGKHYYKSKRRRLVSQRNMIVTAFGPEMVDIVGLAR